MRFRIACVGDKCYYAIAIMKEFEPLQQLLAREDPLVSVIVPTFNKAQYLPETIQSVAAQSYAPIEVMIVNDGSTDNSVEVATALAQQYPQLSIQVLSKPNTGISDTRNFAMERAKGRIFLTLDGDDIIKPGLIHGALQIMRQTAANMVTSPVQLFGGEEGSWSPAPYDHFFHRYDNLISTMIFFDRRLWEAVGGYSKAFPFNEDWNFSLAMQRHGLLLGRFSEPYFLYRVTTGGLANQYIKDSGVLSRAMVATSNVELYPALEILQYHEILSGMPENWFSRFVSQDLIHPNEWLLKFWIGLGYVARQNTQAAIQHFVSAIQLTSESEWQPIYQLAAILAAQGDVPTSNALYHLVRTLCPNMRHVVDRKIVQN